jgi:hypothetical protein
VLLSLWLTNFEVRTFLPSLNEPGERHRFGEGEDRARLGPLGAWLVRDRSSYRWWLHTLAAFGAVNVVVLTLGLLAALGLWNPLAG